MANWSTKAVLSRKKERVQATKLHCHLSCLVMCCSSLSQANAPESLRPIQGQLGQSCSRKECHESRLSSSGANRKGSYWKVHTSIRPGIYSLIISQSQFSNGPEQRELVSGTTGRNGSPSMARKCLQCKKYWLTLLYSTPWTRSRL